jgi:lipopolysaccharide heptosyltransferase II
MSGYDIGQYMRAPLNRILVMTGCPGIGDMIARMPTLKALKNAHPTAKLTVIVRDRPKHLYDLIKDFDFIDEIIVQTKDFHKHLGYASTLKLGWKLRKKKADAFVVLGRSRFREPFLSWMSGAPMRIANDTQPGVGKLFLTHISKTDYHQQEVLNLLAVVKSLGVTKEHLVPVRLPLTTTDKKVAHDWLNKHGLLDAHKKRVAIHARAHFEGRNWPADQFAKLISFLTDKLNVAPILIGTEDDREYNEAIIRQSNSHAINAAGQFSIRQLAALLGQVSLLVGVDSGPMHVAALVGTPTLALYGPSRPSRWQPYGNKHGGISQYLECSPCAEKCIYDSYRCMEQISFETVTHQLQQIVSQPS